MLISLQGQMLLLPGLLLWLSSAAWDAPLCPPCPVACGQAVQAGHSHYGHFRRLWPAPDSSVVPFSRLVLLPCPPSPSSSVPLHCFIFSTDQLRSSDLKRLAMLAYFAPHPYPALSISVVSYPLKWGLLCFLAHILVFPIPLLPSTNSIRHSIRVV